MTALPDGCIDAVITDPPYGISDDAITTVHPGGGRTAKRPARANNWHPDSWWDEDLNPCWPVACAKVAPVVAWFGHWRKRLEVESQMPMALRGEIVWAKDCHTAPPSPLAPRDERIWIFSENGISGLRFETSVWDEPIIPTWAHRRHKNEKPEALMVRLVSWLDAGTILDPFLGSGTTAVAAKKLGRHYLGFEISETYCQIARERLALVDAQPGLFERPKLQMTAELFDEIIGKV